MLVSSDGSLERLRSGSSVSEVSRTTRATLGRGGARPALAPPSTLPASPAMELVVHSERIRIPIAASTTELGREVLGTDFGTVSTTTSRDLRGRGWWPLG